MIFLYMKPPLTAVKLRRPGLNVTGELLSIRIYLFIYLFVYLFIFVIEFQPFKNGY